MKKVTIGGLVLLTLALSACHSNPKSETIIILDTVKKPVVPTTTSVFDKTKSIDTLKK
jgi:hypothetical protein